MTLIKSVHRRGLRILIAVSPCRRQRREIRESVSGKTSFAAATVAAREHAQQIGKGWHCLTDPVGHGLSVWLADRVVPWHKFNLVGLGAVSPQACHSNYQASRCQAETLRRDRCCIDL